MNSILKKAVMAITGLLLVGFLVSHLGGNLLIYAGAPAFNGYASFLEANPLVPAAEIALLILFLIHLCLSLKLTFENKAARPLGYTERQTAGESTFSSRNMVITGLIVAAFIVLHVWQFKYGMKKITVEGHEKMALYELVMSVFQQPLFLAIYIASMLALGLHIGHGIGSAFQSLGLLSNNRRTVRRIGYVLGVILALGFASLPVYGFVRGQNPDLKLKALPGTPALLETKPDAKTTAAH